MTKVEIRMPNRSDCGSSLAELFRNEVVQRNLSRTEGQHHQADDQERERGLIDDEAHRIAQSMNVVIGGRKVGSQIRHHHRDRQRHGSEAGAQSKEQQNSADHFHGANKARMKARGGNVQALEESGGLVEVGQLSFAC